MKLFRPFNLAIIWESNKFDITGGLEEDEHIENLKKIVKSEFENISELTDMEEGLRFALHRLLDLKQMEYEYLKNPFYVKVCDE